MLAGKRLCKTRGGRRLRDERVEVQLFLAFVSDCFEMSPQIRNILLDLSPYPYIKSACLFQGDPFLGRKGLLGHAELHRSTQTKGAVEHFLVSESFQSLVHDFVFFRDNVVLHQAYPGPSWMKHRSQERWYQSDGSPWLDHVAPQVRT